MEYVSISLLILIITRETLRVQQVALPRITQHYVLDHIHLQDQIFSYNSLQAQYSYKYIFVLRKYGCSLSCQNCEGYFFNLLLLSVHIHVEIQCQLDATQFFFIADLIACSACFGHHYAHHQELRSIIRWSLPVVFRAVVFKLLVWCGAEGYVSGLQDVAKQ